MTATWLNDDVIQLLMRGIWLTLWLTAITSILSLIVGVMFGTLRLSGRVWARSLATVYIEIHRNVPALVLIIFWAYAVPNLFAPDARKAIFFDNSVVTWLESVTGLSLFYYALAAIVALTLNTSAYLAELFRAGVGTIHREHVDAARSLGATGTTVFRRILLPQGLLAAFPAITTRLIHNMKNTALVALVAVPDYFHATQASITRTFRAMEFLILAALVYLVLSALMSAALNRLEVYLTRRPRRPATVTAAIGAGNV